MNREGVTVHVPPSAELVEAERPLRQAQGAERLREGQDDDDRLPSRINNLSI